MVLIYIWARMHEFRSSNETRNANTEGVDSVQLDNEKHQECLSHGSLRINVPKTRENVKLNAADRVLFSHCKDISTVPPPFRRDRPGNRAQRRVIIYIDAYTIRIPDWTAHIDNNVRMNDGGIREPLKLPSLGLSCRDSATFSRLRSYWRPDLNNDRTLGHESAPPPSPDYGNFGSAFGIRHLQIARINMSAQCKLPELPFTTAGKDLGSSTYQGCLDLYPL